MFITPGERMTPWVLLIEQKSYLPLIEDDKKDFTFNLGYRIYTDNS